LCQRAPELARAHFTEYLHAPRSRLRRRDLLVGPTTNPRMYSHRRLSMNGPDHVSCLELFSSTYDRSRFIWNKRSNSRGLNANYLCCQNEHRAARETFESFAHFGARGEASAGGGEEGDGRKIGCLPLPNWIPKVRSAPLCPLDSPFRVFPGDNPARLGDFKI
jgi:hypothetical protein